MMLMPPSLSCTGGAFHVNTTIRMALRRSALVGFGSLPGSYGFEASILREGPSCVFVGPVETARKERLEALYQQARDSYYSGQPLIVDDMFDKVEVRLRRYGSKLVMKYPRCSLKRLSAYSDAQMDVSQVMTLAVIWSILLAVGLVTVLGPSACALSNFCKDTVHNQLFHRSLLLTSNVGSAANMILIVAFGLTVGVPISNAALGALQGLWRGDLVALKGSCPSCGEEVYAFVPANSSPHLQHKTECHVCEHPLVFHAKVEKSRSYMGMPWAYGRVYLGKRSKDLAPP